jgi:hypothetical protein
MTLARRRDEAWRADPGATALEWSANRHRSPGANAAHLRAVSAGLTWTHLRLDSRGFARCHENSPLPRRRPLTAPRDDLRDAPLDICDRTERRLSTRLRFASLRSEAACGVSGATSTTSFEVAVKPRTDVSVACPVRLWLVLMQLFLQVLNVGADVRALSFEAGARAELTFLQYLLGFIALTRARR